MLRSTSLILLLPALALAQAPSTRLASFDPASPQGAIESLTTSLATGDASTIRSLLHATSDPERHLVDAMIAMSQSIARLRPVAAKRYGADAAKIVTGDPAASAADQHAKLESAYVQVTGDTAHVTFPDPAVDPITLRRIDGRWRIPVSAHAPSLSAEELEQRAADLADAAKVIDEVTSLCEHGKWQTPNDVAIAIQERILKSQQSRLPTTAPTTQATTQPTTRPQ